MGLSSTKKKLLAIEISKMGPGHPVQILRNWQRFTKIMLESVTYLAPQQHLIPISKNKPFLVLTRKIDLSYACRK